MPKFIVEIPETHVLTVPIEAESPEEALNKVAALYPDAEQHPEIFDLDRLEYKETPNPEDGWTVKGVEHV